MLLLCLRVCRHTHPCSCLRLCVSPHARPCSPHHVRMCLAFSVTIVRCRVLAADGNHVWKAAGQQHGWSSVSGRARACAHGDTTPMHLEDCQHKMHAVCPPVLGHNIPIYEEGALISAVTAVMQECCRQFPPRTFPEIRGGHTNIVMEKNGFQLHCRHCSYRTWKALYTLDLVYNHPIYIYIYIYIYLLRHKVVFPLSLLAVGNLSQMS